MLLFENIQKTFPGPEGPVEVLKDVNFTVHCGKMTVIQGPSGSGKSTLLFTAGAMLPPDSGSILFDGQSIYDLSISKRNRFRGTSVGFVFQRFHLIPYLNVEENLLWALRRSKDLKTEMKRLPGLASDLGIQHRLKHRPAQLSAGEQQRVAVARALIGNKKLICADEPAGNLDKENAEIVIRHLRIFAENGGAVLMATHNGGFEADEVFQLRNGKVVQV